ncbi:MAG: hypothetical protein ACTSRP_18945 [Candidatus Helarchaeota archaeon]
MRKNDIFPQQFKIKSLEGYFYKLIWRDRKTEKKTKNSILRKKFNEFIVNNEKSDTRIYEKNISDDEKIFYYHFKFTNDLLFLYINYKTDWILSNVIQLFKELMKETEIVQLIPLFLSGYINHDLLFIISNIYHESLRGIVWQTLNTHNYLIFETKMEINLRLINILIKYIQYETLDKFDSIFISIGYYHNFFEDVFTIDFDGRLYFRNKKLEILNIENINRLLKEYFSIIKTFKPVDLETIIKKYIKDKKSNSKFMEIIKSRDILNIIEKKNQEKLK